MAMNKKGQLVLVGLMISIFIFFVAISFIPVLKPSVASARSDLSCGTAGLGAPDQLLCLVLDSYLFMSVGVAIFVGIAYIGMKKLTAGG